MQSITVRLEEWRLRRRDTESWMRHRQLPNDLQERVRKFVQYKWVATRGVDEESILRNLPPDLRRDIQRHLSLDLVRRVRYTLFLELSNFMVVRYCKMGDSGGSETGQMGYIYTGQHRLGLSDPKHFCLIFLNNLCVEYDYRVHIITMIFYLFF